MTKKLGIFGDSFAASGDNNMINPACWPRILRDKYNYEVTNYAQAGTGISFGYYHFLKYHENFDKIIFLLPSIYRGSIFKYNEYEDNSQNSNSSYKEIENRLMKDGLLGYEGGRLENKIKNLSIEGTYALYDNHLTWSEKMLGKKISKNVEDFNKRRIEDWCTYGYANDLLNYNAIMCHISYQRPQAIIIHSFNQFDPRSFSSISDIDYRKFKQQKENRLRTCHMSHLQNQEVANNMDLALKGKLNFVETLGANVYNFYTPSETAEQAGLE